MARTVVIADDMDGSPNAEEVIFGWDGVNWSIDLSEANKTKLQELLQPYLDKAHPAQVAQVHEPDTIRRRGRPRTEGAAATGDKIDYTDDDHFGQLHRGRLNDAEIQRVKDDPERASRNREAQGHPPIDFNDDKEQSRYNLTASEVAVILAKLGAAQ